MRKTFERALALLTIGKSGRVSRSDIIEYIPGHTVRWKYHGNTIVECDANGIKVDWCGWYTISTAMRIYALCEYLGAPRPEKVAYLIQLPVGDRARLAEFCGYFW